jgi:hypothetical protein
MEEGDDDGHTEICVNESTDRGMAAVAVTSAAEAEIDWQEH